MYYTLKDHQGSLTATVCGNTVERLSYDAWGRRRNPVGFGYSNVTHTFDRGYTLHEHYDDFGLINMNGRCYDPVIGRMLSPDVAIQDEHNMQAYNRYSYCFNNPLRFTDPSGYVVSDGLGYLDWNYLIDVEFDNLRINCNSFNTDLSEGIFNPVYDLNGKFLGTTIEGFTGQVLIYKGKKELDFSNMSVTQAYLTEDVDTFDNLKKDLSGEAKSNIWTDIVSQMEGCQVFDETFSLNDLNNGRIIFDPTIKASWLSSYVNGSGKGRIRGSGNYKYETTVENVQSSIIVHEYYSHIKKNQADEYKSHRWAYKNVINFKSLWNETTPAYKGFVVRKLQEYTKSETGRPIVDPPYRYSYNKYKHRH